MSKDILTQASITPVGGRCQEEEVEASNEPAKKRDDRTVEPLFFHGLPEPFYLELLGVIPLTHALDLTPGDGRLAMAALQNGGFCCGLAFGVSHKKHLQTRLEKCIWNAMSDSAHELYEPRLVALGGVLAL